MVEFWGLLGALVPRTERDEREGSSEGGGFYKSRDLGRFFPAVVSFFFFLLFGGNNRAFGVGLGKFGPVLHFLYFSSFCQIFPHLFSLV